MVVTKKGKAVKHTKVKLTEQGPLEVDIAHLRCGLSGGDAAQTVTITNNTDQAVPKGRKIFWKADNGDTGSVTLQNPLVPGKNIMGGHTGMESGSCEAWYFNPPPKIFAKGKIKAGK